MFCPDVRQADVLGFANDEAVSITENGTSREQKQNKTYGLEERDHPKEVAVSLSNRWNDVDSKNGDKGQEVKKYGRNHGKVLKKQLLCRLLIMKRRKVGWCLEKSPHLQTKQSVSRSSSCNESENGRDQKAMHV